MTLLARVRALGPWLLPGALASALLVLLLDQAFRHGPAMDEPVHLVSGLRMWRTGVLIDSQHPPLPFYASALPVSPLVHDLRTADRSWATGASEYVPRVLLDAGTPLPALLARARLSAVAVALALGLVVFVWSRRLWGHAGATLSLALYVFCPVVLGDGALVGDDLAAALALLVALAAFRRYLVSPSPGRLAALAVAFAVAALVKFVACLLMPMLVLLYAARRALERAGDGARNSPPPPRAARDALLVGAVCFAAVWACYGFSSSSLRQDPELWARPSVAFLRASLARWPSWLLDAPIPAYDYWKGLAVQIHHSGHQASYSEGPHLFLLGQHRADGWWYYFPVAFALKTPLPVFVLGLLALLAARRRGFAGAPGSADWPAARTGGLFDILLLAIPAAVWLSACMLSTADLGVRYLMPLYPLAFVSLGALGTLGGARPAVTARSWGGLTWVRVAIALCLVWYLTGTLRVYPHFHAYFNELAGGPDGGWRALNNSSIDWGQDVPELGRYLQATGATAYGDLFSALEPAALGTRVRPLPRTPEALARLEGLVAVSVTRLTTAGRNEPLYARLRDLQPRARIGHSIFVYDLPARPGSEADDPEHAPAPAP